MRDMAVPEGTIRVRGQQHAREGITTLNGELGVVLRTVGVTARRVVSSTEDVGALSVVRL